MFLKELSKGPVCYVIQKLLIFWKMGMIPFGRTMLTFALLFHDDFSYLSITIYVVCYKIHTLRHDDFSL